MSAGQAILARVYRLLTGLYPAAFRANFADEVLDVFETGLQESARQGAWPALMFCLRELADFPANVVIEHVYQREKMMGHLFSATTRDIHTARWIARISGLLLAGFFTYIILTTGQPVVLSVTIVVMNVGIAIAWRWEKTGGLIILGAALLCAILVGVDAAIALPDIGLVWTILWGLGCMLAVLLIWYLPYELLGWMFVSVARHSDRAAQPPDQGGIPVANGA